MAYMYGIAITNGVASLFLLRGFAYITFKMTSKKWNVYYLHRSTSSIRTRIEGSIREGFD